MSIDDILRNRTTRAHTHDAEAAPPPAFDGNSRIPERRPAYAPPPAPVLEFAEPPLWSDYEDYDPQHRLQVARQGLDGRREEIGYIAREAGTTALLRLGKRPGTYFLQPIDGMGRPADEPFSRTIAADHQHFTGANASATAVMAGQAVAAVSDPLARELLTHLQATADRETQTLRQQLMAAQAEKDASKQALAEKELELNRMQAEWANRQMDAAENLTGSMLARQDALSKKGVEQMTTGFAQIMAMMMQSSESERARMKAAAEQEQRRAESFQATMTTWITEQSKVQAAQYEAQIARARAELEAKNAALEAEQQRLRDDARERERERRAAAEREEQRRKEHAEDRLALFEKMADDKSIIGSMEKFKEMRELVKDMDGGSDDSFFGKIGGLMESYGKMQAALGGGFDDGEIPPEQMAAMIAMQQQQQQLQIPQQPPAPSAPQLQEVPRQVQRQGTPAVQVTQPPTNPAASLPADLQKHARAILRDAVQRISSAPPAQHVGIVGGALSQHAAVLAPFCRVVGVENALEEAGASTRMASAIVSALDSVIPKDIPRRIAH